MACVAGASRGRAPRGSDPVPPLRSVHQLRRAGTTADRILVPRCSCLGLAQSNRLPAEIAVLTTRPTRRGGNEIVDGAPVRALVRRPLVVVVAARDLDERFLAG